jgi:ankyrin repeat protein
MEAAAAGDLARVEALIAQEPSLLGARDGDGATALHHAAFHARREVARHLVRRGADPNPRDGRFGATPAGWAIEYLRELGGCLATEIEDVLFAIERRDTDWVERFLARTPALADCASASGKPLREYAADTGSEALRRLFESARKRP